MVVPTEGMQKAKGQRVKGNPLDRREVWRGTKWSMVHGKDSFLSGATRCQGHRGHKGEKSKPFPREDLLSKVRKGDVSRENRKWETGESEIAKDVTGTSVFMKFQVLRYWTEIKRFCPNGTQGEAGSCGHRISCPGGIQEAEYVLVTLSGTGCGSQEQEITMVQGGGISVWVASFERDAWISRAHLNAMQMGDRHKQLE